MALQNITYIKIFGLMFMSAASQTCYGADFSKIREMKVVQEASKLDHQGQQEFFKRLETVYHALACNQPFHVRRRGSIGFVAGAAVASASVYFNYRQRK